MRRPSYKFEARTRDYRLVVCIDLMTEYLQTVDKNTKQLTLYEFQERINREYEKIPTVQGTTSRGKYIGDAPDGHELKRIEKSL